MRRKEATVMKKLVIILAMLALTVPAQAGHHGKARNGKGGKLPHDRIKNIIVMISDGCGYNQIDAASLYQYGRTGQQVYEHFPVRLGMSTYMDGGQYDPAAAWKDFDYVKSGATDSAAAATTMSAGEKTYSGAIGVDVNGEPLTHAIEWAEARGMATGVVTSVEFSHATPAGFVAHNVSRNNYAAIANEMIYESALEVIMGAGAPDFDNDGNPSEKDAKYVGGPATFNDLSDDLKVMGADADGDGLADAWQVIRTREDFKAMAKGPTPRRLIGLPFVYQTLQQSRSNAPYAAPYAVPLIESVPTLEEMTRAALNVLDDDEDGFFLMVEGGAVDWAGHANQSGRVIEEEIDFNRSVEAVMAWVKKNSNWGETLLIVTGDHETGYLNGPEDDTANPTWEDLVNNGEGVLPGMGWHSGDHTNQLIPFFAKGSAARLFKSEIAGEDPVRGRYIDNTAVGLVLIDILSK
jgi:alkaline phosphatase